MSLSLSISLSLSVVAGEPELIDQLILGLGLGSRGQQVDSPTYFINANPLPIVVNTTSTLTRGRRSISCEAKQICHHVTTPHGKLKFYSEGIMQCLIEMLSNVISK